ncbi:MAG TPA: hypothetical protein ENI89_09405 [Desulfobulbus sp.]|nr:hypothetical protein [Desulfobulbus sp.]
MRYLVIPLLALLLLTGCDALQDMGSMFEKQGIVQKVIRDRYGWETGVGWNMQNGRLTRVTVSFSAADVAHEKVLTLEQVAREAVGQAFRSTPEVICVQVEIRPAG